MTPNRWQQIEEIFQMALDLSPDERRKFIDARCSGDAELKIEVEKLLSDFDAAEDFIESPVWTDSRFLNSVAKNEIEDSLEKKLQPARGRQSMLGRRIGVYELKEEIGRGGMGAVYLATRADGEFRQKVAIKLIKRGMDTDFVLKRFRRERQILANLNHTNIVLLLDGGTTDDGLPYFVMDFVEGEPLNKYCSQKNLNLRERLELFRQVCEAIDYAHQKKVVHRDLKPSNILVNKYGIPKLLDFGIAKLLDPEQNSDTLAPTETNMRLMTPEYASPEQVSGGEITPASDIYSLGVLLYLIVTGQRPYKFSTRAPYEVARIICEQQPPKPSRAVSEEENQTGIFKTGSDKDQSSNVKDQINESLDKIILKALRKNPAERYETAADLSEDILRYLQNQPVKAEDFSSVQKKENESGVLRRGSSGEQSIAILPFRIIGSAEAEITGADEYLGIGLSDALVMRLSGVERMIVRPTSSVLRYQENADPFAAGRELGVDFIVEGNIRRVGDRISVNVHLLNVAEQATRWAEKFNEKFNDVLELEDSISERIAVSLLPYLTGAERRRLEKRGTNNVEAYEAYLRRRFFWNKFTGESLLKALDLFEKAIALDANYALAYVGVADVYNWLNVFGVMPSSECMKKSRAASKRALEIDDTLGEAYTALAFTTFGADLDWAETERLIEKSLRLNPNNWHTFECLSYLYTTTGRFDEGLEHIKRAEKLDPLSPRAILMTAWTYYQSRRYAEASEKAAEAFELEKDFSHGLLHYGNALMHAGKPEEAVNALERCAAALPDSALPQYMLSFAYVAAGRDNEARAILSRLKLDSAVKYVKPYFIALTCVAVGEYDEAFGYLDQALEEGETWLIWLATEPKLDVLRSDARFARLLRRTKNPAAEKFISETGKAKKSGEKSIAVLPFKLLSGAITGDSGDEFLSLGLADSLITRLSNVRRLTVRPTSSVLPFTGSNVNPFSAGRELGVNYVLDGNVRRAGTRLRVTVQLLNTEDNSTEWAQKFDEDSADVIEIEDSISEKVVGSLIPHLTGEERQKLGKRGTSKPEAYESYLRGRFYWNKFTAESLPKALEAFEQAIALDPDYALAYVGLADFYTWANIYGIIPASVSRPNAERAARRALELDPSLGEAYAALGLVNSNLWNWDECQRLYRKSIELNPNYPNVHEWYSAYLVGSGQPEEGIRQILISERLDPLSLRTMTLVAWTSYQARMFDQALEKARQIIELDKNYPQGYLQLGNILTELGRHDEAVEANLKCAEMMPDSQLPKYPLCFALARAGRLVETEAVVEEMRRAAEETYVKPYFLAMAYAAIGDVEGSFEYFEKAFAERDAWLLWFGTEPKLDFMRDDPRFNELFLRTKNPLAKVEQTTSKRVDTGSENSIAVLPLKMLGEFPSNESGEEFLGVGLTDALIMRLSQLRRFTVRPTSSVLSFHAREVNPFEAGEQLGVRFILDGNIRRSEAKLRVTLQLLNVEEKSTVWAKQFNSTPSDIFALEDEISEQVAKNILPQLSTAEQKQLAKRGTDNAEAYEAYLRGRIHWNKFSLEGFSRAFAYFQRAAKLAPDYALAYTGLADYYNFLGVYTVQPFSVTSAAAREYALRAVSLDPSLSEAYAALGFAVLMHDFDWQETEVNLRRAVELNPNYVLARVWYSYFLGMQKRFSEAFEQIEYALKLDSITPIVPQTLNWTFYYARRYEESIAATRSLLAREPNYGLSQIFLSHVLSTVGEYEEAIRAGQKAVELIGRSPYTLAWLAATYAAANRRTETFALLSELEEMSKTRYVSPYMVGMAYSNLGDKERALSQLETAMAVRDARVLWLIVDPQFDWLQGEKRFQELLRRTGNPAAA